MKISAELSLYPLREGFVLQVEHYIKLLKSQPGIRVQPNSMSTQIFGDYDAVMGAINTCTKEIFAEDGSFSLVCKLLNSDRSQSEYRS